MRCRGSYTLKPSTKPAFLFYSLDDKVYRSDVLHRAYDLVKRSKGGPGLDGETFATIETGTGKQAYLQELQETLKAKTYQAMPIKRVDIPKANGATRSLGTSLDVNP